MAYFINLMLQGSLTVAGVRISYTFYSYFKRHLGYFTWLLRIVLQSMLVLNICLCFSLQLKEFMDHRAILCSVFWGTAILYGGCTNFTFLLANVKEIPLLSECLTFKKPTSCFLKWLHYYTSHLALPYFSVSLQILHTDQFFI